MRPEIPTEMQQLIDQRMTAVDQAAHYPEETRSFMETIFLYGRMNTRAPEDWAFRNYYDLAALLSPGPRMAPLDLPEGYDFMEAQQCFHNSWELALEDPSLLYCEGFAQARGLVVEHAWVETPEGVIIDPTWAGMTDENLTHATYLGVRFTADFAARHSLKTGWASIVNGDVHSGNRILRNGLEMRDGMAIDWKEDS